MKGVRLRAARKWSVAGAAMVVIGVAPSCGRVGFDETRDHGEQNDGDASVGTGADGGAGGSSTRDASGGASSFAGAGGVPRGGDPSSGGSVDGDAGPDGGAGDATSSGGSTADSGGARGSGGASASGGAPGSGGASASGGAPGSGGSPGSGGNPGSGGATSVGADTLASGEAHTCVVRGGLLYCWGRNTSSALGGVGGASSNTPVHVLGPGTTGGFTHVSAGVNYGCARDGDGKIWCWGDGTFGQTGAGDVGTRSSPNPVTLSLGARGVSGPSATTCTILTDDSLWCWGQNTEGQGAQNEPMPWSNELTPVKVPSPTGWRAVGAGQGHVCGVRQGGTLWCWGRNTAGQLGQGVSALNQIRTPTQVGGDTNFSQVSAGQMQTCALRANGTLWCFGDNGAGQLGTGDLNTAYTATQIGSATDWLTISTNTFHSCGIRSPGLLFCWGRNVEGQLGVGDYGTHLVPTRVDSRTDWAEVSTGRFHTCARRTDSTVWCAGDNPQGQLGNGNLTRPNALVAVAAFPP